MSSSAELSSALSALLDELDRLMLVGASGRQRRGAGLLSVETLRYARIDVANVLTDAAPASSLRGFASKLGVGLAPDAPLRTAADRVEAAL